MEQKIYLLADLHIGHKNIVKGKSNWTNKDACRDFTNVKEMNSVMLKSINDTVGPYDRLIFVGDLTFAHDRETIKFLSEIKCKNLEIIYGNHDQLIKRNKGSIFKPNEGDRVIREMFGIPIVKETEIKFTNIFNVYHGERLELDYNNHKFIIDHYPLEVWNHSMRGSIMCHGHVHGALDTSDLNMYHKRIDVRWDLLQRPISLDEIIEITKDRKNLEI